MSSEQQTSDFPKGISQIQGLLVQFNDQSAIEGQDNGVNSAEVRQLREELNMAERDIQMKERILEMERKRIDSLQNRLNMTNKKITIFEERIKRLEQGQNIRFLDVQYVDEKLKSDIKDIREVNQILNNEKIQLEKTIKLLQDISSIRGDSSSHPAPKEPKTQSNEREVGDLKSKIEDLSRTVKEKSQKIREQQIFIDKQARQIEELKRENEILSRSKANSSQIKHEDQAEIKSLQMQLSDLAEKLMKQTTNLTKSKAEKEQFANKVNSLQLEKSKLNKRIDQLQSKCRQLQREAESLKNNKNQISCSIDFPAVLNEESRIESSRRRLDQDDDEQVPMKHSKDNSQILAILKSQFKKASLKCKPSLLSIVIAWAEDQQSLCCDTIEELQ